MEGAFGADFAHVRVHTGPDAADLNRKVGAEAFTVASDIYFRDGMPDVSSADGQRLLAHELTHTLQQGGGTARRSVEPRIQRKVGFEFEDRTWRTWIATDLDYLLEGGADAAPAKRAAHKKEVLDSSRAGFKVEADKFDDGADMEVVTVAFDETDDGIRDFNAAMVRYLELYRQLDGFAGQHDEANPLPGGRVGLSNPLALLSAGAPGGEIQMHVTAGVPLEKLPSLIAAVGSRQDDEDDQDTTRRRPMRRLMYGPDRADDPNALGTILSESPAIAARAMDHLATAGGPLPDGDDKLYGLLSMVVYYARMFSLRTGDRVAKYRTMLMARVDFGSMFTGLPDSIQDWVLRHHTVFETGVVNALQAGKGDLEDDYQPDTPLFRGLRYQKNRDDLREGFKFPFPEVTISNWLWFMMFGQDLACKNWATLMADRSTRSGAEIDEEGDRLRGLADMSSLDRSGETEPLAIVENRAIHPKGMGGGGPQQTTAEESVMAATRYFMFMKMIRDHDPGAI